MPLDSGIYSQVGVGNGYKSVADYDAIRQLSDARKQQLQQGSLALLTGQQALAQTQATNDEKTAARKLISSPNFDINNPQHQQQLLGVAPTFGPALLKTVQEGAKDAAQTGHYQAQAAGLTQEQGFKRSDRHTQDIGNVTDVPGAINWIGGAVQNGQLPFEQGSQMAARLQADPSLLQQWKQNALAAGTTPLEQRKFLTPDANSVLSAQTSTSNNTATNERTAADNAAARGVTVRGQNMTDARSREGVTAGKIPAGYRLSADGQSLEAMPGGPAALGKALPSKLVNDIQEQAGVADNTIRLRDTFKPEYANKTVLGDLSNTSKRVFGDDTGQSQWWQDYALHESTVRHKLFGASLTPGEQGQWAKLTVTPRMDAKQVEENLARRAEIEARGLDRLTASSAAGGYNKEQIEAVSGRPVPDKKATVQPSTKANSVQTPDGQVHTFPTPAAAAAFKKAAGL